MELEEYLQKNRVHIMKFCKDLGTTFPTLAKIRRGILPVICKVMHDIEKKTNGQVTFKDMLETSNRKKVPKKNHKADRCNKNNQVDPAHSLENL